MFDIKIIWILTQILFAFWGICLCLTFLFGCFRLLQRISRLPVVLLSSNKETTISETLNTKLNVAQSVDERVVDPDSITPSLSAAKIDTQTQGDSGQEKPLDKPKIKITDENELTVSYASDTPSQHNITGSIRKSKSNAMQTNHLKE